MSFLMGRSTFVAFCTMNGQLKFFQIGMSRTVVKFRANAYNCFIERNNLGLGCIYLSRLMFI